jgi:hypothetical protein
MPGEPVCSLIVFCDLIVVEQGSGKNSLIGTFPNIASPVFPFPVARMSVHVEITNIVPEQKPVTAVVNIKAASGAVLGSVGPPPIMLPVLKNQPPSSSGLHVNLNVFFQNLGFHAPGTYECEVIWNGESIGSRKFDVVHIPPPQINPSQNQPTQP